jgi:dTMP kinase
MAGLLITFEGIEGSGKTTQIKRLSNALQRQGYEVVLTREPGGTPLADSIRHLLLDRRFKGMSPLAELFLYEASRAAHVDDVIRPALKRRAIVLCDRFTDATVAYQGYGRGLSRTLLNDLNKKATQGLQPDLTFLLDCPPDQGLKRARGRNLKKKTRHDRFEREAMVFHRRVRQGYLKIMSQNKKRFVKINAALDVDSMHKKIIQAMEEFLQ